MSAARSRRVSALLVARDPSEPDQFVIAHTKASVGPHAASLAYRLEPVDVKGAGEQVRVQWLGEVDRDAADLLGPSRHGKSAAREECRRWLATELANDRMAWYVDYFTEDPEQFEVRLIATEPNTGIEIRMTNENKEQRDPNDPENGQWGAGDVAEWFKKDVPGGEKIEHRWQAAKELKVSYKTLLTKIEQYQIRPSA